MSQIWKNDTVAPVTVIKAEPNTATLIRTKDKDGYEAAQIGFEKNKKGKFRNLKEFRISGNEIKAEDIFSVDQFKEGDLIKVSGLSKGRGFQGVVKRHGFHGGPKTHGQKNRFRAPGSIGSTAPQRVLKGKKMAGHMGTERVTTKNLEVVGIDKENNLLLIKGAVPGAKGGLLEIRK